MDNKKHKKGNKGEWSEFYAFIKILTDGKVFSADKNLKILEDNFYLVLKIIREEANGMKSYDISKNNGMVSIFDKNKKEISTISLKKIKSKVVKIFEEMKNLIGTTFSVLPAEELMKNLHSHEIKASNGRKADLKIVLHDKKSPDFPELGFSIKSMLGSPSTLLNASGATNFVYRISNSSRESEEVKDSGEEFTVREAAQHIYSTGKKLEFCGMDNEMFRKNLRKIDSVFHEIMAEIIKHYYNGDGSKISDLVDCISEDKEFIEKIDFTKDVLIMNVKRFLSDVALGMTPSRDWDGRTEAQGGYIIVKENGEVICYHLYNRDQFEDYLFSNTKLDTPSTTRHKFGKFYKENGEDRIKFNLQIRFLK